MVRKEDGEVRALMKKEYEEKEIEKWTSSMFIYLSAFILTSACNTREGAPRTILSKEIASHRTLPKIQNSVHVGCNILIRQKNLAFSPSRFGLLSTI